MRLRGHHEFMIGSSFPCFLDKHSTAGETRGHYFHQDLYVARRVALANPRRHADVGSSISGFVSHVASFRELNVLDLRPLDPVPGINFIRCDICKLPPAHIGKYDSVSSLSVLEHFGLGRYGDSVDPDGWRDGLGGLEQLLEEGGTLYLSVPAGAEQRVEFNAHRVFNVAFLRDILLEKFEIVDLAIVDDAGMLHEQVDPFSPSADVSFGCNFGNMIWTLRKRAHTASEASPAII